MRIIRLYQKLYDTAPAASPPDIAPAAIVGAKPPGMLRGVATVYNTLSSDFSGYRIRILPGAFSDSIKSNTVLACWMHNDDEIIGSTKNKTLRLTDDNKGLRIELDVAPTSRGYDSYILVAGKYLSEMSIGFGIITGDFVKQTLPDGSKIVVENVSKAVLYECSIVAKGAMPQTSIQAITTAPPNPAIRNSQPMTDRARLDSLLRRSQSLGRSGAPLGRAEIERAIRRIQAVAN